MIETDHEIGCPIRQLSGVLAGAVPVAIDGVVMMSWWLVAPVVASTMIRTCQEHSPRIFHVLTCAVRESFCAIATSRNDKTPIDRAVAVSKKVAASSWGRAGLAIRTRPNISCGGHMGAEMRQRMSRLQLYNLVWAAPVTGLAPQYGISDVALKNTCRKFDIPVPPRGYWARLQARETCDQDRAAAAGGRHGR